MTTLLAVDPGIRYPAAALFKDGVLVKASRVQVPPGLSSKTPVIARCRVICFAIDRFAGITPDTVVCEYPQIYDPTKQKGNPNQLIPLAVMGGVLAGLYPNAEFWSPLPHDWTGNVPKAEDGDPWKSPRGQRVWNRLSPKERLNVVPSHDAIDAVGLGLFGLGRFERRRVNVYE